LLSAVRPLSVTEICRFARGETTRGLVVGLTAVAPEKSLGSDAVRATVSRIEVASEWI